MAVDERLDGPATTTRSATHQARRPLTGQEVLIIEDDAALAATLRQWLEGTGYRVWWADSGAKAQETLSQVDPSLILLDLALPDVDGLLLCVKLKLLSEAPIMIATARRGLVDRVLGLKFGAEDFLLKPLDLEDLLTRIEAVLHRRDGTARAHAASEIRVGSLSIDRASNTVRVAGDVLRLTPTQYRILLMLATSEDEVVSRQKLAQLIWDAQELANLDHLVDIHVSRLRLALKRTAQPAPMIITVRGRGYKLQPEALPA